jgi:hypothetical protein
MFGLLGVFVMTCIDFLVKKIQSSPKNQGDEVALTSKVQPSSEIVPALNDTEK